MGDDPGADVTTVEEMEERIREAREGGRQPLPWMVARLAELKAQRAPIDSKQAEASKLVDLSDSRLQQVALAARRRTGRGLSSTFVSGQGVGGSLLGGG